MSSFALPLSPYRPLPEIPRLPAPETPVVPFESFGGKPLAASFGEVLNGYLHKTVEAQNHADQMVESLALGEPVDVHQVMLALNEASNAIHLTLQVRGKILEAYQEVMRMPL
jgi:flagellar hook-basal body complex protein FliE